MSANPDLAAVAVLIANPSRAAMLTALLSGTSLPASTLARCAKISPQTASTHLARLVSGGLLTVTKTGRHRYYALQSRSVAQALEALALIAPAERINSLNQSFQAQAIRRACTCYDHLAGALGVAITEALVEQQMIWQVGEAFEITASGAAWLADLGVQCEELHRTRRALAIPCLDWSERKPHLAGSLSAAIAERMFQMKWVVRTRESRAVKVTDAGAKGLEQALGIRAR